MLDGATYQGSQASLVNFAPIDPLRKLKNVKDSYKESGFLQMIREWHNDIWSRHADERREIAETARLMSNIRSGKLTLKRDPIYGGLVLLKPLPQKPRSDRHVYPLAQVNSSQLTSIWTLSRPRPIIDDVVGTSQSNTAKIQRSLIQDVADCYTSQHLFDEYFQQRQSLSMMDYGTSIVRLYYDRTLNQLKQVMPIISPTQQVIPGYGACLNCEFEGHPGDFQRENEVMPRCPDCGSYNTTDMIDEQKVSSMEVTGSYEYTQGDIGLEMLDVAASVWDMRVLPQDSEYFGYRSEVPLMLVREIVGEDVRESGPEDDVGRAVINALGTRGGAAEGWGRENAFGNLSRRSRAALMDEEYYSPSWYSGIRLEKAEKTISGQEIPANTPLEEVFPDGICVVGFNDMKIPVGVWNERRHILGSVYHIQSHSGVGKGTSDAIEITEQLSNAHSANLAMLKRYGAGGGYWYDKDVMTEAQAKQLLRPGGLVGVSMRKTNYASVEQALQQIRHGELSQSNLTMVAQLANLLNISFQTTDFTPGVASDRVNINTLGGQQLLAAQNQQRSAAPLRMKGWAYARIAEEFISMFRETQTLPRYFSRGDKFGLVKGRFISGGDIPERVVFTFSPDSELPTNSYDQRQANKEMLEQSQYFGIPFIQLMQMKPRIAAWWASKFRSDLPLFDETSLLIVCQDRLDNLKTLCDEAMQNAQESQFYADPAQVAEDLVDQLDRTVFMDEDNHTLKAEILSEYLDDDETKDWNPYMRAAVPALINRHYKMERDAQFRTAKLAQEGAGALQQMQANTQLGIQGPIALAQQQAQAQAAQQQANQQQQAEVGKGILNFAADQVGKEEDFNRDRQAAIADHAQALQLAAIDHAHGIAEAEKDHAHDMELAKYERKHNPGGSK